MRRPGTIREILCGIGFTTAIKQPCDSNRSYLVLQRCGCKNLCLFDLRGSRKQLVGPRTQGLCDLATQVGIAPPFICKGVEDTELRRPKLDRIPPQGPVFIESEGLSRLQKCFG